MFRQRFLQVGALVFAIAALAQSAPAASFSEANLKGNYSFMRNKWTTDVSNPQVAMVGVLTFDGAGNVTGSATAVRDGEALTGALGGTYNVKSDGAGAIDITSSPLGPMQLAIVLNSAATGPAGGFQFVQTGNPNNLVNSGTALLQSPLAATYSSASLQGSFSFLYNTWSADPDMDQDGGVGVLTFDGKGNLEGSWIDVYRGQSSAQTATGTYTVNAHGTCSASLLFADGSTSNLAGALNSVGPLGANGLQLVLTNPGPRGTDDTINYAITMTAVKQGIPSMMPGPKA